MKVFVVEEFYSGDARWVDSVFATREAAEREIRRRVTVAHEAAVANFKARAAFADRWVAAGGGLSAPLEDPGTLEEWLAEDDGRFQITEHDVQGLE